MNQKSIYFQEAKRLLEPEPGCVMLDVREEEEFITGHPVEAELLPLDSISPESAADHIPTKETPVLVYCRSGARSAQACSILKRRGYDARNIGGVLGYRGRLERGTEE